MLSRACIGLFLLIGFTASERCRQGDDYAETKAKIERGLASLRAAAADWPDVTVGAIGKRLGTPAACLAFVRLRVRHEPYAGIMRGSQGVLDAAAGNSAELCVLLRDLIVAAGATGRMRFAMAELDEAAAAKLVDAAMQRPVFRPAGLMPAAAAPAAPAPSPASEAWLRDAATETRRALRDANADVLQLDELLGGQATEDRAAAIAAARAHVWLQLERAGTWISFDPIADLDPPADARLAESLPAEWQHLAAIDLEVERLQDGKLSRESVLAQQWPVAEIQGRAIEVMLVPDGLSMQKLLSAKRQRDDFLAQAKGFSHFGALAGVTGGPLQPGRTFDLGGKTQAAARGPVGVGAVDPFGRLPRGGAVPTKGELSAVFLTVRLRGPGGERVVERALLDRVGAAARAANTPALAAAWAAPERVQVVLLQRHLILVPAGALGQRGARQVLDCLLQGNGPLAALDLDHGRFAGKLDDVFASLPEVPGDLVELSDATLALAEAAAAGDGLAFLAQPNLYLRDETLDLRGATLVSSLGIDVAEHRLAVLGKGGGAARRLHGCLVSELEGSGAGGTAHWAAALLREAHAHGIGLVAVRTAADLAKVDTGADTKAVMAAELARGNALLAMAAPFQVGSAACTAWWRVDAQGHVLAVGGDGRGQGGSEGMTVLTDISIPMVRRCLTFVACLNAAVAGGASMQDAGGKCLARAIRDIVKESLDKSIDSFVKQPLQQRVDAARAGMLGDDYEKLYQQAKAAWGSYQQAQALIADPLSQVPYASEVTDAGSAAIRGGADIGSAYGGKIYLLLAMGRDIADYGSRQ